MNTNVSIKLAVGVIVIFMIAAIAPLPYGYYQFLRLAVTLVTVAYIIGVSVPEKNSAASVAFGVVAFIYNPLLPVYLPKEVWMLVNPITAAVLVYFGFIKKRVSEQSQD